MIFQSSRIKAFVFSDGTHRVAQAEYLLTKMGAMWNVFETNQQVLGTNRQLPESEHDWPDLVISIGSLHGNAFLHALKSAPKWVAKIHLFNPEIEHDLFDLIILPDYEPELPYDNIMQIQGIFNKVQSDALPPRKEYLDKPVVALLLGGKSVYGDISTETVEDILAELQLKAGKLFISSSKRTGAGVIDVLKKIVTVPHIFYDYKGNRDMPNPYLQFLADADIIIASHDSVRMVSEAVSTGKPTYIWQVLHYKNPYEKFHEGLIRNGYARWFQKGFENTNWHQVDALNELNRVANTIVGILLQRKAKKS